jgi:hypothetical protein
MADFDDGLPAGGVDGGFARAFAAMPAGVPNEPYEHR